MLELIWVQAEFTIKYSFPGSVQMLSRILLCPHILWITFLFLKVDVELHLLLEGLSPKCALSCFCFCLRGTQTIPHLRVHPDVWPSTGSNWLYRRMTTVSRPTPLQRQTLCVCIYVICQAREAKCGRVWQSARYSKRDRTEQAIFFKPLWLNSLFSHQVPGIAPSLSMSDILMHSGQKPQQANRRKPGVRQQQGGVCEQIKRGATELQLIKSQTLCLGLFSSVSVGLQTYLSWAVGIMLTSILFMFICCCLLKSNMDGAGLNIVVLSAPWGVCDLPPTHL